MFHIKHEADGKGYLLQHLFEEGGKGYQSLALTDGEMKEMCRVLFEKFPDLFHKKFNVDALEEMQVFLQGLWQIEDGEEMVIYTKKWCEKLSKK